MFEVGTVCVKLAGRDAGKKCVVVEEHKDGFVVIEGETRRRKCNIRHLEPVGEVKVSKGASHDVVMKALGFKPKEAKPRKAAAKPTAHASRKKPTHKAEHAEHKAEKKAEKKKAKK